jgi:dipeptidyl aminopeptidase/acylaminoacyl peptidase
MIRLGRIGVAGLGFVVAVAALGGSADAARFGVNAMTRLVELSSPQISPDGATVVLLATRADLDNDQLPTSLDRIDVASGSRSTIVPARSGLSSPSWSPDATSVALLAQDGAGASQIFVVDPGGGALRQVTRVAAGVEQFAWRPDGRAFAYVSLDLPPKKRGAARFRDAFVVGNNAYTARSLPEPAHVYTVASDGSHTRRLTRGTWTVVDGEDQSSLTWSSDGKTIAFARAPNPILNDQDEATVWLSDAATGALRKLTSNHAHETEPLFAPAGNRIAYFHARGNEEIAQSELYVTAPGGPAATNLSHALDRTLLDAAWRPDGSGLVAATDDGERRALVALPLHGTPHRIDLGGLDALTDSMLYTGSSSLRGAIARNGNIAFIGASPQRPSELYVLRPGAKPRRLTAYNAFATKLALPRVEPIWYDGPDGFREEAVLTYPVGYAPGRRYPLVVKIHGGPDLATRVSFDPLPQLMAARGWFVLQPNYRGSTNLGLRYQRAVAGAPSSGPEKDILAAIDVVKARGSIDERRIGVSGWSYGGLMTAWMIAKHHFWKAAMVGAPVTDMLVDYSTADDLNGYPPLFGGPPFSDHLRPAYARESPLTYVADITTPVLIMHNVGDARCPIVNSYLLFRALKNLHRPVQFIAYPIDVHEPSDEGDPVRVADYFGRWVNWFAGAFENAAPRRTAGGVANV